MFLIVVIVFKGKKLLKERPMPWDLGARVGPAASLTLSLSGRFAGPWNLFRCVFFCAKVFRFRWPELATKTVSDLATGRQNQLKFNRNPLEIDTFNSGLARRPISSLFRWPESATFSLED